MHNRGGLDVLRPVAVERAEPRLLGGFGWASVNVGGVDSSGRDAAACMYVLCCCHIQYSLCDVCMYGCVGNQQDSPAVRKQRCTRAPGHVIAGSHSTFEALVGPRPRSTTLLWHFAHTSAGVGACVTECFV